MTSAPSHFRDYFGSSILSALFFLLSGKLMFLWTISPSTARLFPPGNRAYEDIWPRARSSDLEFPKKNPLELK
jgi:hypothetical protein